MVGKLFSKVTYIFLFNYENSNKKNENKKTFIIKSLLKWVLIEYVCEKYYEINAGKLYVTSYTFRDLILNIFFLTIDFLLVEFFFFGKFYTDYFIIGLFTAFFFGYTNKLVIFTYQTTNKFLLFLKFAIFKSYIYILLFVFYIFICFRSKKFNNIFQENIIKFLFFYSFLYYF